MPTLEIYQELNHILVHTFSRWIDYDYISSDQEIIIHHSLLDDLLGLTYMIDTPIREVVYFCVVLCITDGIWHDLYTDHFLSLAQSKQRLTYRTTTTIHIYHVTPDLTDHVSSSLEEHLSTQCIGLEETKR